MSDKNTFKPGDKFILELGAERRMFHEFEIAGTDLYVKTDLLDKLKRYEPSAQPDPDNLHLQREQAYMQGWEDARLIDRQAAIDAINELHDKPNAWLDLAVDALEQLPSAHQLYDEEWRKKHYEISYSQGFLDGHKMCEKRLPRWIPCSEQMPEEHEWMGTKRFGTTISDEVYVTFENPKGERFCKHLSFQNGKLSSFDQSEIDAFYKGSKPIAWKPLPEPYEAESEE